MCQALPSAAHPGSYTPDLAAPLSHLYFSLSQVGQYSEALPPIEESVKPCTQSDTRFGRITQHSEALSFVKEIVQFRRQLVAIRPELYTPYLATSLSYLYCYIAPFPNLDATPMLSEALPFTEESVKLCRQLVVVYLGLCTPHLAASLNHPHRARAVFQFIEESVELCRQVHPELYVSRLTFSLEDLQDALSNLGQREKAPR
ncbi:uncharacterized protein EI90DRAFT_155431 [Cantharellus anzutake]|uniref:uncharacterized protein n=1 Tax=Cantharellus anzutake TaxID=1750568 RepID=UPI0019040414|nr:uncharacterized protein EI90DRAFT_155431 [Cantharellus anzutake]KAF8336276.1 hypothetical protein EI90DRAFT_155431 [Cantharellus anzutake]